MLGVSCARGGWGCQHLLMSFWGKFTSNLNKMMRQPHEKYPCIFITSIGKWSTSTQSRARSAPVLHNSLLNNNLESMEDTFESSLSDPFRWVHLVFIITWVEKKQVEGNQVNHLWTLPGKFERCFRATSSGKIVCDWFIFGKPLCAACFAGVELAANRRLCVDPHSWFSLERFLVGMLPFVPLVVELATTQRVEGSTKATKQRGPRGRQLCKLSSVARTFPVTSSGDERRYPNSHGHRLGQRSRRLATD